MNDIKKLIQMLKEYQKPYIGHDYIFYGIEFCNPQVQMCIEALEKQLNGGWIPVSERLPEEYGCYLVAWRPTDLTAEDIIKNTGTVPHYYEIVEYDLDDEALWIGGIEQCDSYEILAWQSLPEPYKEVGQ
jgi:hypothetical protein